MINEAAYHPPASSAWGVISVLIIFSGFPILNNTPISEIGGGNVFMGFTGLSALVVLLHISRIMYHGVGKVKIGGPESYFIAFMVMFFIALLYGYVLGVDGEISIVHANSIIQLYALYVIGKNIVLKKSVMLMAFLPCMIIALGCYLVETGAIPALWGLSSDRQIQYQTAAMVFLVSSTICTGLFRGISRWVVVFASIFTLFSIGARSEFVAYIVSLPFMLFSSRRGVSSASVVIIFLGLIYFARDVAVVRDALEVSRVGNLLDLENDNSYRMRMLILTEAWDTIVRNPFFGDYGSYAPGNYAHNILSAWVDLGIVGILTMALLIIRSFKSLLMIPKEFLSMQYSENYQVYKTVVTLLVQLTIMLFTAKAFFYPLTGLVVGLIGNLAIEARRVQHRRPRLA